MEIECTEKQRQSNILGVEKENLRPRISFMSVFLSVWVDPWYVLAFPGRRASNSKMIVISWGDGGQEFLGKLTTPSPFESFCDSASDISYIVVHSFLIPDFEYSLECRSGLELGPQYPHSGMKLWNCSAISCQFCQFQIVLDTLYCECEGNFDFLRRLKLWLTL